MSGGLQVHRGSENRVGRVPRLVTNRDVVLILEGEGRIEETVKLNVVTGARPEQWLLHCVCVCVCNWVI